MRLFRVFGRSRIRLAVAIFAVAVFAALGSGAGAAPAHASVTHAAVTSAVDSITTGDGWAAGTATPAPGTCLDGYSGCDPSGCPIGFFCAWSQPSLSGCWMMLYAYVWANWGAWSGANCGGAGTWSWDNESPDRVWREQSRDGSGTTHCISPYPYGINLNVTPESLRVLGWIQLTSNTADC
jgi:hypothetical protein